MVLSTKGGKGAKTEKIFRLNKFIGLICCKFTCDFVTAENKKTQKSG